MRSFILFSALAALASADSVFDLGMLDDLPTPLNTTIPSNISSQVVVIDTEAAIQAAASVALSPQSTVNLTDTVVAIKNTTGSAFVAKRATNGTSTSLASQTSSATSGCTPQPTGYGPATVPDTASAFLANPVLKAAAAAAPTPSGYYMSFNNLQSANNAYGYLGYYALKSYDTAACAAKCSSVALCQSFNIYFERDPSVDPGASCPDPASTNLIKCVLWSGPVTVANANNNGQYRNKFHVVIAGNNGYVNSTVNAVAGYSHPAFYWQAAIDAPNACNAGSPVISTKVFTNQAFDANLCGAVCSGQPNCAFFNTFLMERNGVSLGQYCRTFSIVIPDSYATYTGTTSGGYTYTIASSYGYARNGVATTVFPGLVLA